MAMLNYGPDGYIHPINNRHILRGKILPFRPGSIEVGTPNTYERLLNRQQALELRTSLNHGQQAPLGMDIGNGFPNRPARALDVRRPFGSLHDHPALHSPPERLPRRHLSRNGRRVMINQKGWTPTWPDAISMDRYIEDDNGVEWESDSSDDPASKRIGKAAFLGKMIKDKLMPSRKTSRRKPKSSSSSSSSRESSRRSSANINQESYLLEFEPSTRRVSPGRFPRMMQPINEYEGIHPETFTPDFRPSIREESSGRNPTSHFVNPESYSYDLRPSHRPGRSKSVDSSHQINPESYTINLEPSYRPNSSHNHSKHLSNPPSKASSSSKSGIPNLFSRLNISNPKYDHFPNNITQLPRSEPPSASRIDQSSRLAEIGDMNRTFVDGLESLGAGEGRTTATTPPQGSAKVADLAARTQMYRELGNMNRTYLEGMVPRNNR